MEKFIDLYNNEFDICFIQEYTPIKYLKKYDIISLETLINLKEDIKKQSCILITQWYSVKKIPGILEIALCYFSSFNQAPHYMVVMENFLNNLNRIVLLNFTNTDYYNLNTTKYLIGDIHIDNLLYKKNILKKNLPRYDIVYFPNYAYNEHAIQLEKHITDENQNRNLYKETSIINNVLKRYSKKYSIITLPHPNGVVSDVLNGFEFINPVYFRNGIDFIPNAKVIINSCKSFAGVCLTLNKSLIHLGCHLKTTVLPIFEDFLNIGSYNITDELTEEIFEDTLKRALNDEKREIRQQFVDKYAKEIYDENLKSPTEKIRDIIHSLI